MDGRGNGRCDWNDVADEVSCDCDRADFPPDGDYFLTTKSLFFLLYWELNGDFFFQSCVFITIKLEYGKLAVAHETVTTSVEKIDWVMVFAQ